MAHYITINHDKRFIAFFSPKCGRNTIANWFKRSLDIDVDDHDSDVNGHLIDLSRLSNYPDYHKVIFIRNPFRRLVSFFSLWVVRNDVLWCFADDARQVSLQGKSFAEFVDCLDALWSDGREFQHHLKPQMRGLDGITFDDVIRLETFNADIERLNQRLQIRYTPRHLNPTPYDATRREPVWALRPDDLRGAIPTYEWFYNDRLIDIVNRIYAADVRFYYHHLKPLSRRGEEPTLPRQPAMAWTPPSVNGKNHLP